MIELPNNLPSRYRYALKYTIQFGVCRHSYELIGAHGGLNVHVSGPHVYDGGEHWSAGFEVHSRTPLYCDDAPSHDQCWLLQCPCWHGGSSLQAEERYLPLIKAGAHDLVFWNMVNAADDRWMQSEQESAP